jgi:hypothetical protein
VTTIAATVCPTGTCTSAGALTYACPPCTATTFVFRVSTGASAGAVCSVAVTDRSNGDAVTTFQAISVKNPSGKFALGFDAVPPSPTLGVERHAHQALPVRATDARRQLCAFGGARAAAIGSGAGAARLGRVRDRGAVWRPVGVCQPVAAARHAGRVRWRRRDRRLCLPGRRPHGQQRDGGGAARARAAADRGAGGDARRRHRSRVDGALPGRRLLLRHQRRVRRQRRAQSGRRVAAVQLCARQGAQRRRHLGARRVGRPERRRRRLVPPVPHARARPAVVDVRLHAS